ncbi:zinc finger MYM-type protein 1-like [Quercus lobata]|uniref:zinc finger MYM-type protein 1-like n=1 Tax=Quercus lobata TaxID=97700 RepID=UPI00124894A2|nr:zinc finger MYM-type protein 1-like [Quercus lobata]
MKEKQHIQSVLAKQSNQDKIEYRVQLNAIVDCIRFILYRGLAFRGHNESQGSSDKINFLELLQFLADHNESINEVLQKAPKNCKLTQYEIQKDIVNVIARETSKTIIQDLDNGFFSILVDELRNISVKEQMALVLRNVNKKGIIIERFLGIVHVASTTALSLKYAIECLLCERNLSLSKLRGQGYDGASNMQVIDLQLQELNNHFSEANTNLLLCMTCLNLSNSFVAFDKEKLIRLAKFYSSDFPGTDILALGSQL